MATRVKAPRMGATIAGWERVRLLVVVARRQRRLVVLLLLGGVVWICRVAAPSWEGRVNGKWEGEVRGEAGRARCAVMGWFGRRGQRLYGVC